MEDEEFIMRMMRRPAAQRRRREDDEDDERRNERRQRLMESPQRQLRQERNQRIQLAQGVLRSLTAGTPRMPMESAMLIASLAYGIEETREAARQMGLPFTPRD